MAKEIKIIFTDINNPEWMSHPFDVYIDGEIIPRLKRFSADFSYFDKDQRVFDTDNFTYTVEQFIDIAEEKPTLDSADVHKLYDFIHNNQNITND